MPRRCSRAGARDRSSTGCDPAVHTFAVARSPRDIHAGPGSARARSVICRVPLPRSARRACQRRRQRRSRSIWFRCPVTDSPDLWLRMARGAWTASVPKRPHATSDHGKSCAPGAPQTPNSGRTEAAEKRLWGVYHEMRHDVLAASLTLSALRIEPNASGAAEPLGSLRNLGIRSRKPTLQETGPRLTRLGPSLLWETVP